MRSDLVTLVWVDEDPQPGHDEFALESIVQLVRVRAADVASVVKEVRVRGGVVVVAKAEDAERFLALGADEALCFAGAKKPALEAAVQRARARASARLDGPYDVTLGGTAPDGGGLALLAGAMVHHITDRLAGTLGRCDRLEELSDEGAVASVSKMEGGQPKEGLAPAERAAIRGLVVDVARDVRKTADLVQTILALTGPTKLGMCNLSRVALEVVALVQRQVDRVAQLSVDVPAVACVIPMGRAFAMQVISSLIRNAMESVERAGKQRGWIDVRVNVEDDLVVLEISDDGAGLDPEVRRRALDSPSTVPRIDGYGVSLAIAAGQVRRGGGEMLVDSEDGVGTTVRVFFPASTTFVRMAGDDDDGAS
jgi:signal transduction histidine kinase